MDLFTFIVTVFVSFLGILFGAVLTHHTRDEVFEMRKLIPFLQFAILVAVFVVLFLFFPFTIVSALLVLSFGFIYIFWRKNNLNFLDYIVLSMILVISSVNPKAHLYVTLFAFIFGILSGSLFYVMNTKHKKHQVKKLAHHRHTGKHLDFHSMTSSLFYTYKFFFFLAIIAFAAAHLIDFLF
ncbi:MAG: hypothetical protein KC535_00990 [Nanoarchaeota archaeon]|nr:hypothetical protein [Nanoarchaeota archaeon]